jgi:peptide/nickel transport system substrate-binding protein
MRRRLLQAVLILFAVTSLFMAGFVTATEKPAPKATPAATAPKAAAKATPSIQPQLGGILKIIEVTGPKTPFGWPVESVGESTVAHKPIIESLVRLHYNGRIEPWLAESWKVAPDKKSVTFVLRKGVKFHDGTDFNAEAAKFNLDALKAGKNPGTEDWSSIDIIDAYTVRINLLKYSNILLSRFGGTPGSMVSPTAFKTKGIEWARWNPVGTGPFEFVSFERDASMRYKKFYGYWQKGKPYLDGLQYVYIKDPMTQAATIEAGEAHVLNTETGKMAADLKAMGLNVYPADTGVVVLIPDSMNTDSPLANKKVREAVDCAIDKEAIVKAKGYGFWQAAYQLPTTGSMAYQKNLQGRKYDPAKAKKLLAEAGYPKGFKTRIIPHFAVDRDVMVSIQSYLSKVGITVDLEFVDQGKFTEYRRKGWKNGFLCQPLGEFPNYLQSIEYYFAPTTLEFPSLKKPAELGALLNDALLTINPELPKIYKALKTLSDDITVVPIHTTGRACISQKNVHDTGHLTLGNWGWWTSEKAWMSK